MEVKYNKELLNRNAWEEPDIEGVAENNKTAKSGNDEVKIIKGGTLEVNESAKPS